jgi:hypothetical protein
VIDDVQFEEQVHIGGDSVAVLVLDPSSPIDSGRCRA